MHYLVEGNRAEMQPQQIFLSLLALHPDNPSVMRHYAILSMDPLMRVPSEKQIGYMLDERLAHPTKRRRKPIRPFSPEPSFRKTKRTRKDLLDSNEDTAQDKLLQGGDILQWDKVAQ
jgi:hypothetical protein